MQTIAMHYANANASLCNPYATQLTMQSNRDPIAYTLAFQLDSFNKTSSCNGRCATNKYFQIIGSIHDIESYFGLDNTSSLNVQIFFCHWGHLAIIFVWVSRNLFHTGWNANYELWVKNSLACIPIAHAIWDPHFAKSISEAYSSTKSDYTMGLSYSGIYNWLYTVGFNSVFQIYNFVIICELLAVISIPLGKLHCATSFSELLQWLTLNKSVLFIWAEFIPLFIPFTTYNIRLNFHTGILMGFWSIAWCGHLVHSAIPISRGTESYNASAPIDATCIAFSTLTFLGGLKSNTISLYLTDIGHHHLGVGLLFVWASHVYLSLYKAFGYRTRDVLYINSRFIQHPSNKSNSGLEINHVSLAFAVGASGVITSVEGQHIYSLTPYLYLSYDYIRTVALYVHHSWIAEFLIITTFAHFAIFLIRDLQIEIEIVALHMVMASILAHKGGIISHCSFLCLWLGFHTMGVYIHNDTIVAFGEQEKQILIEPRNAQIIQQSSGKALYAIHIFYSALINHCKWNEGCYSSNSTNNSVNKSFDSFILPLGAGDTHAHHAIAIGLHITVLILLKGAFHGRGSKLMPDKIHQHYGYSCDGPGRGGTCDISAWDSFYLAIFWMLNTRAWITFYFHWKHFTLWQNTVFQFDESSTYLNAWFGDYLWFNSTPLIHGYNTFGANDVSIWAWAFLGAHLCWATAFMFLISWRGYWQELIDIILYMHFKTPILYNLWNGDIYTPLALSIVQARFVGLVHFGTGFILTYPPFIIGATS
jgi:photosystem I P700 chlorophyll a apoprotein A2